FEAGREAKGNWKQLSTTGLRKVADAIDKFIQPYDILAHYKTFQCAILLPHTDVSRAARVAQTVIDAIVDCDPDAAADHVPLKISMGIAGFPEDCNAIGPLLSAADEALNQSRKSGSAICAFRELYNKS
ncbi:MAG: GGDEF domain-containing protein, partial [Terriglobales bacterium]